MKKLIGGLLVGTILALGLSEFTGAGLVSKNISKAFNMHEINRRIVLYNGVTGEYILTIEGLCSLGKFINPIELSITCKTGPGEYKKHFFGLSDNVTYFAEHLEPSNVGVYHYRVVFKPQTITPDVDFRGDTEELKDH